MIPAERSHLRVAAKSHPGMRRKNNEDRYAVSAYRLAEDNPLPSVFAIVSDGIGGHRAGEIAAEIAVETISQYVAASDGSEPVQTLKEAIVLASTAILQAAENDPEKSGMGATCVCAWVIEDRLYTACVGDSRIYLLHGEGIIQLSTDHTWVQEAIQAGILDPEQAREHPNAHVIRRYLGSSQPVEPDLRLRMTTEEDDLQAEANQGLKLLPGDQILLCSDGLTDLIHSDEILASLKNQSQPEALDELTNLANLRGGHDNITLVSIQMPVSMPQAAATARAKSKPNLKWVYLAIALFVLLSTTILAGGWYFYKQAFFINPTSTLTNPPLFSQPAILPTSGTFTPEATRLITSTPAVITPSSTTQSITLTPWPTNTTFP